MSNSLPSRTVAPGGAVPEDRRTPLYHDYPHPGLYATEERHWWFVGARRAYFGLLDRLVERRRGLRCLDAGCGTGINLVGLAKYGTNVGVDYSPIALNFCRRRGLERLAAGSVGALPFAGETFDLVTCIDVLNHRDVDEARAFREFYRVLKPGGLVFGVEPAHRWLWSAHDNAQRTTVRFHRDQLQTLLEQAGFCVRRVSYFNTILFPPLVASRLLGNLWYRLSGREPSASQYDVVNTPAWVAKTLELTLAFEGQLLQRVDLPYGGKVMYVAERRA